MIAAVLMTVLVQWTYADEDRAMQRLMSIVDGLSGLGEEMVLEPVSGTLVPGDTLRIEMELDTSHMYHLHAFSDSFFNEIDFWLSDPSGEVTGVAGGDHASLAVYPETSGTWTLNVLLHRADGTDPYSREGADSASFAAAVFRGGRYL